jgi:undecaprenyl-diphosphatase
MFDFVAAVILGILEGLTEFIPVSSTGHLLLASRFLGLEAGRKEFWDTFSVLIQFGAILALLSIYFVRLWRIAIGFFTDPAARGY